jgi:sulfur carrier protein ThiS adenylyltransferase
MNLNRLGPAKGGNVLEGVPFAGAPFRFMDSISEKLSSLVVGIAGLGGLGSNVAIALARAGVGRLIIADFDNVEQSNLNRQHYFCDQTGRPKVDCMIENLQRINPQVEVVGHRVKLDSDNVLEFFAEADVIAECFDTAGAKQMIVETVLSKMTQPIVSVSGLAGYGKSNEILTRRVSPRLVLIGDGRSGVDTCEILTAARVGVAAMHQANAILEILIEELTTKTQSKEEEEEVV